MMTDDFAKRVGYVFAQLAAKSFTRREIAASIGTTAQTMRLWETGTIKRPPAPAMYKLEDMSGISGRWVVLGEGPKFVTKRIPTARQAPPYSSKLLLPRSDRRLVERVVSGLLCLHQPRSTKGRTHGQ